MFRFRILLAAFAAICVSSPAPAQICTPFTDVAASDPFCGNIQWMFNRGVTLGCHGQGQPAAYCPAQFVRRDQMAAFMNRLADNVVFQHAMPSWDQTLPAATRFIVLTNMNSEAVLDRETGLVWEQSPSTALRHWQNASAVCNQKTVGNRKGWRLPTIQELTSLADPANPGGNPDLPPGHPFSNVPSFIYWSATTFAQSTTDAWFVDFDNGGAGTAIKSYSYFVWCVRGGQGPDAQ